jgi:predicted enzyme related to lactoylglutathione lyase
MIGGVHTILYSKNADAVRAFLRDVLEFDSVDAGHGWLIFAAPPGELAVHPGEGKGYHELYLMCSDIRAVVEKLGKRGVEFTMPVTDRGWGLLTQIKLPDGEPLGLYEPRHKTAIKMNGKTAKGKTAKLKTGKSGTGIRKVAKTRKTVKAKR